MKALKQAHIKITGHVQGVFFRANAKDLADRLHVGGSAKNMPDGSLEIIAQGKEESLKQFIEWCWQGTPAAKVENVSVEWEDYPEKLKTFEIL